MEGDTLTLTSQVLTWATPFAIVLAAYITYRVIRFITPLPKNSKTAQLEKHVAALEKRLSQVEQKLTAR